MAPDRSQLALEEYRALRATIRERGTARVVVTTITFVSWAGLALAAYALSVGPLVGLLPLVVLAAGFEGVFALHVGVERIGRYLQARYEEPAGTPGWEHAAMSFGANKRLNPGVDALFFWPFIIATLLNLMLVLLLHGGEDIPVQSIVWFSLGHGILAGRLVSARRFARRQRQADLDHLS